VPCNKRPEHFKVPAKQLQTLERVKNNKDLAVQEVKIKKTIKGDANVLLDHNPHV